LDTLGCAREVIVFDTFRPVTSPGRAFLEAGISSVRVMEGGYGPDTSLVGLKLPDDACDAAFTSCNAGF